MLGEPPRLLEARLFRVCVLAAAAHHSRELVAIDVVHRAERLHELALVGGGDHADGVGARQRAELGGEDPQAPGGAPDQDPVAGLEPGPVEQHPVGGEVREPVGGRLLPGEMRGLGQELLGLHLRELREGPPARLVAPDPLRRRRQRIEPVDLGILVGRLVAVHDHLVPRRPAGDPRPDLPDDPRGIGSADVVILPGVVAKDGDRSPQGGPDVVEVDAGGHDADDDLERGGLGDLDLLDQEGVDGLALAVGADDPGRHGLRQLARLGRDPGDLGQIDYHVPILTEGPRSGASYPWPRVRPGTLPMSM